MFELKTRKFLRKLRNLIWRRRRRLCCRNEFERNTEPRGLYSVIWADQWAGKYIAYTWRSDPFSNSDLCLLYHNNITDYFQLHSPNQPIPNTHNQNFLHPSHEITKRLTICFMCARYCTHKIVANNHCQIFLYEGYFELSSILSFLYNKD
jgi:hypothetical protein